MRRLRLFSGKDSDSQNYFYSQCTYPDLSRASLGGRSSERIASPAGRFPTINDFCRRHSLFYRFEELKLCVSSFYDLFQNLVGGRSKPKIIRICWYTIQEKYERTLKIHGSNCLDKVRVIFGAGVPTSGEPKEKGVDALLVADLIYHSAQKNMDYAQLVAIALDFVFAIRRVEDFGCRSAVLAFGQEAPDGLRKSCDDYRFIGKDELVRYTSIVKARTN